MLDQLETLADVALTKLSKLETGEALDTWNSHYIGRKGELPQMLRRIGELPPEERPVFGQRANQLKRELETAYEEKASAIKAAELEQGLAAGGLDVTLPGRPVKRGRLHPSTQTLRRIYQAARPRPHDGVNAASETAVRFVLRELWDLL
jgi:phenylalanyl-tRNA synthetase alpha chain